MLFLVFLTLAVVNADRHIEVQTGDANYVADLEDVSFFVFYDGVPGDYEYSYDYSDLTVKPEESDSTTVSTTKISTTGKIPTSSLKPEENISTTESSQNSTTEKISFKPDGMNKFNHTIEHPLNTENFQIPVMVVTERNTKPKKGYISSSTLRRKQQQQPHVETESLPKRTCLNGFALDEKNRCKKKITARSPKPPLPGGLRYPQGPTTSTK